MIRRMSMFAMMLVALLVGTGSALAVPTTIQYDGRLTDAAGAPLSGTNSVVFSIFATASGGSALWTETQSVVSNAGLFSVQLGSVTAFPPGLFANNTLFLAIKVGSDAEMTPRQPLSSVPFAQRAGSADAGTGAVYHFVGAGSIATGVTDSLCSIVLNAPAAGFALVQAGFESYLNHVAGELTYMRYQVNNAYALSSFSAGGNQHFVQSSLPGGSYDAPTYCARLFPVVAGANRFFLMAANVIGSGSNTWQMVNMSAIFIPTALGVTAAPQDIAGSVPGGTKAKPDASASSPISPDLRP